MPLKTLGGVTSNNIRAIAELVLLRAKDGRSADCPPAPVLRKTTSPSGRHNGTRTMQRSLSQEPPHSHTRVSSPWSSLRVCTEHTHTSRLHNTSTPPHERVRPLAPYTAHRLTLSPRPALS